MFLAHENQIGKINLTNTVPPPPLEDSKSTGTPKHCRVKKEDHKPAKEESSDGETTENEVAQVRVRPNRPHYPLSNVNLAWGVTNPNSARMSIRLNTVG